MMDNEGNHPLFMALSQVSKFISFTQIQGAYWDWIGFHVISPCGVWSFGHFGGDGGRIGRGGRPHGVRCGLTQSETGPVAFRMFGMLEKVFCQSYTI